MPDHNIFSSLSRHKTEEFYFAQALVYVLQLLRDSNRKAYCRILNKLCFSNNSISFEDNEHIDITTEQVSEESRPDIEIRSKTKLVYVEVKVHSPVSKGQLQSHEKGLEKYKQKGYKTNLVLLTVPGTPNQQKKPANIKSVTSDNIYNWLADAQVNPQENVGFLITQYRSFLERFKKVSLEYVAAVMEMIESAGKEWGFDVTKEDADGWGFKFLRPDDVSQFWCGIYHMYPRELCFSILLEGKVYYDLPRKTRGKGQWYEGEPLPLDAAFSSLSNKDQYQKIKDYINREWRFAQEHKIVTPMPATRKTKRDLLNQPEGTIGGNQVLIEKCKGGEYQLWKGKIGYGVVQIVNNKYVTILACRHKEEYARGVFNECCSTP